VEYTHIFEYLYLAILFFGWSDEGGRINLKGDGYIKRLFIVALYGNGVGSGENTVSPYGVCGCGGYLFHMAKIGFFLIC